MEDDDEISLAMQVRKKIENLVDEFVVDGALPSDILNEIGKSVAAIRLAYVHDPDPADDATVDDAK